MIVRPGKYLENYDRPSIFLAGPTPRSPDVESWRPHVVELLDRIGFFKDNNGVVFVPEPWAGNWEKQVEWEDEHLKRSSCIMFWIDRNLEYMPGFTTNIEWGAWCQSGKVVLGIPEGAPKTRYIQYYAKKYNIPQSDSMLETVKMSAKMAMI